MRQRVEKYRRRFGKPTSPGEDCRIGCILLAEPTFFPAGSWVREPSNWSPHTVQGETLDLSTGEGRRIWTEVMDRIGRRRTIAESAPEGARYGAEQIVQPRLGQGTFRVLVTDVYRRRCAVTGERTLPVLEAAHVRPYAEGGRHELVNGILLRSDLHTLFDRGYVTITRITGWRSAAASATSSRTAGTTARCTDGRCGFLLSTTPGPRRSCWTGTTHTSSDDERGGERGPRPAGASRRLRVPGGADAALR